MEEKEGNVLNSTFFGLFALETKVLIYGLFARRLYLVTRRYFVKIFRYLLIKEKKQL
jgi:hypothetical protein